MHYYDYDILLLQMYIFITLFTLGPLGNLMVFIF